MKILFLLVLLCVSVTVQGRRGRQRVKRSWAYGIQFIDENVAGESFKEKRLAQAISSSKHADIKKYVIEGKPEERGIFEVRSDKKGKIGWIYQIKPVDREVQDTYEMEAFALDGYGNQVEEPINITVTVLDKNDESPAFLPSSLNANVTEDTAGKTFHKLQATDKDSSQDNNNVIEFTKIPGSEHPPGDRFEVQPNGNVVVIGELDADNVPRITFTVQAEDRNGVGGNKVNATVSVDILDANDHAPVFVGAPYAVDVKETLSVGLKIPSFQIRATDADTGINSQVYFKITSGNDDGHFDMVSFPSDGGDSVGELKIAKELDYETPPTVYYLTVIGYNADATNADDVNYQTSTTITVNVVDENEPPTFHDEPYVATVIENTKTKYQNLDVKIKAIDYDYDGSQTVTYSLQEDEKWFEISQDGTLKTIDFIDREDPRVNQETSTYTLVVQATDSEGKFENAIVTIKIIDDNDNAPEPYGGGWKVNICDRMTEITTMTTISAMDKDSNDNGPPFTFSLLPNSAYEIARVDDTSARIVTHESRLDVGDFEEVVIIFDTSSTGKIQTGTATLSIHVCSCETDGTHICTTVDTISGNSASTPPLIIGIILAVLLLVVLVLGAVSIQRRKSTDVRLLHDDDDIRDTLQPYHDEGGGEEDNDVYDMGALQPLALKPGVPYRMDEKPLFSEPRPPMALHPDTKVEEFLQDAKKQADGNPIAPPFDSLLVFDYEGHGSDAGTLSSINSATTDSQDYDYLKVWGPRYYKIADLYGGYDSD